MQAELDALWAEVEQLGRPRVVWSRGPVGLEQSKRALSDWEQANPEKALRHSELTSRASAVQREMDRAAEEDAKRLALRCKLLEAGVGERNLEAAEAELSATEALTAATECARTFLLLTGGPGTGKSVAAAHALRTRLQARPCAVLFLRASECARLSLFDAESQRSIERMKRAGALALDDLGMEAYHDTWRQILEEVLDERYQCRRFTVLTSNLDTKAFVQRYGDRIADRLRHDGRVVACGKVSFRRPQ